MPVEVSNTLSKYFLENSISYEKWGRELQSYQIPLDDRKKLRKLFPLPPKNLHLYKIVPNLKSASIHIDRGRKTALQVPCNINPKFKTFSQKNNVKLIPSTGSHYSAKKNKNIITIPTGPMFFCYEEEKFETYVTDLPYLQNVGLAHGGVNSTKDVDRYFWSISYIEEFDYVCDALKEWI